MSKKRYIYIFLICLTGNLFAQGLSLPDSIFAGIGPEVNGYTRSGHALGGSLQLGLDLNDSFAVGQKTGLFTDFESIRVLELMLFFRYYLPWSYLHWPSPEKGDGPFAQLEAGAALSMEHGYHIYDEVFPSFAGGAALGWRFNLPPFFYVEPALRFGYPYTWGFGVTAGVRFKIREQGTESSEQLAISNVQIEEENHRIDTNIYELEEDSREQIVSAPVNDRWSVFVFENDNGTEEHILAVLDNDDRLRIQVPSVVFRANHSDFAGLSEALLDSNANTLRRIAQMLNTYKEYNVLIEGHANPTTPAGTSEREEEEPSLKQLSEERARRILEELVNLGVDRDRLITAGMSSSSKVVPYNDRNNWKNRRVEFILLSGDMK